MLPNHSPARRQRAASALTYGVLLGLIAVAALASIGSSGLSANRLFGVAAAGIRNALPTPSPIPTPTPVLCVAGPTILSFDAAQPSRSVTVPPGCSQASISAWGAGGGAGGEQGYVNYISYPGGGGAFAAGRIAVTPGESLTAVIGQGGDGGIVHMAFPNASIGGGGRGLSWAGSGGGYTGLFRGAISQANALIVAAGGGGGGLGCAASDGTFNGGAGGADQGLRDSNRAENGYGGQSPETANGGGAIGAFTSGTYIPNGPGGALDGGTSSSTASTAYGAGGGGGYWGGGGGGVTGCRVGAAGGGSSFVLAGAANATRMAGSGATPGGSPPAGIANGGAPVSNAAGNPGGHGRLEITWQ